MHDQICGAQGAGEMPEAVGNKFMNLRLTGNQQGTGNKAAKVRSPRPGPPVFSEAYRLRVSDLNQASVAIIRFCPARRPHGPGAMAANWSV